MKKTLLFSLSMVSALSFAQNKQMSNALIEKSNAIQQLNVSGQGRQSITPTLLEVKKNWSNLSKEAQDHFKPMMTRPTIANELIYQSAFFDFHYAVSGADSVSATDLNTNNVPDYIDVMAYIADTVFTVDSAIRKFTMPPPDNMAGGTNRYDIYVYNLASGIYGTVNAETPVGDNPNSTNITEASAYSGYMSMRNNYVGFPGLELDAIKVTLAHELSHSIDFGYGSDFSQFFLESKGAWEEQVIYPTLVDNFQYFSNIFGMPDVALNWQASDHATNYNGHWYGTWTFLKHITDHTNDSIMRTFLEVGIGAPDEKKFMDSVLAKNYSWSFTGAVLNYFAAIAVMSSSANVKPYDYVNAATYAPAIKAQGGLKLENIISYSGTNVTYDSDTSIGGNKRLMRLSADYFYINAAQNYKISLTKKSANDEVGMFLVKMQKAGTGSMIKVDTASGGVENTYYVSDVATYDSILAVVVRFDAGVSDTMSKGYVINIEDITTSIPSHELQGSMTIYPSPANNQFVIDYSVISNSVMVEVRDILGKSVFMQMQNNGSGQITCNTEKWNNGVYFVTLKGNNGKSKIEKIVVAH